MILERFGYGGGAFTPDKTKSVTYLLSFCHLYPVWDSGRHQTQRKDSHGPMRTGLAPIFRRILTIALVAGGLVADPAALAQSSSCSELSRTLNSLNRAREYRNLERNTAEARRLSGQLQDMESRFVRGGCQRQLNNDERLTGDCRALARSILAGREDYNELSARIETGQAVAEQRELALQQIARFGCNSAGNDRRSSARFEENIRQNRSARGNLFNRLFGNEQQEGDIVDRQTTHDFGNRQTLRSVCVRACDGYYWPVSFATLAEYLGNDESLCQQQCPESEVSLYYYRNPGEEPEDMVDLQGNPYSTTPNAFRYRREYDPGCTCKRQIDYGSISLASNGDGGQGRAMVRFEDKSFPMPRRDPRRGTEAVVAGIIDIPLPRPRPARAGESVPAPESETGERRERTRTVEFGDETVRVVGPDTPFARSGAEGS